MVRVTLYRNLLWIIALLAAGCVAAPAQAPASAAQAQSSVLRVTSPRPEQRQTDNFVTVHYELQNPTSAPAGSPDFQVQLDGNDPVTTTTTEQSFTGLTPGQHVNYGAHGRCQRNSHPGFANSSADFRGSDRAERWRTCNPVSLRASGEEHGVGTARRPSTDGQRASRFGQSAPCGRGGGIQLPAGRNRLRLEDTSLTLVNYANA